MLLQEPLPQAFQEQIQECTVTNIVFFLPSVIGDTSSFVNDSNDMCLHWEMHQNTFRKIKKKHFFNDSCCN